MKDQHKCFVILALVATLMSAIDAAAGDVPAPGKFLSKAIQDGNAEIQSCELALQKSSDQSVKSFASRMIADHKKINSEIELVAANEGVSLPAGTNIKQKAIYETLKLRSGSGFDKTFMEHNVSDHKADIKDFTEQSNHAQDSRVKTFATNTLPTLKAHLKLSQETRAQVDR